MTLKSLRLQNFQVHTDLYVPLDPGITAILGPTNCGKSSVFRSIRWLVEHKPATGLLTHGTDSMSVSIETDQTQVSRFKTPKEYGYSVGQSVFVACANSQPLEIRDSLGLSEINLQGQHDPPFLLTLTPGQMARELNRIVDLSVIDKANAEAASRYLKAKNTATALEEIEDKQIAQVESLAWVSQADADLSALEDLTTRIEASVQRRVDLLELCRDIEQDTLTIGVFSQVISELEVLSQGLSDLHSKSLRYIQLFEIEVALSKAESDLSDLNACGKALAALRGPAAEIQKQKERLSALRTVLVHAEASVEISHKFSQDLENLLSSIADLRRKKDRLDALMQRINDLEGIDILPATKQIAELEQALQKAQKEQKVCPTCKRPL